MEHDKHRVKKIRQSTTAQMCLKKSTCHSNIRDRGSQAVQESIAFSFPAGAGIASIGLPSAGNAILNLCGAPVGSRRDVLVDQVTQVRL
jgi:hypothetical protein